MGFADNFFIPLLQALFYGFMLLGGLYLAYRGIKKLYPDFFWVLKYKTLRKKYDEKKVAFCMEAHNNGISEMSIRKEMLIAGSSFKEVDEMAYIFNEVCNNQKGGK